MIASETSLAGKDVTCIYLCVPALHMPRFELVTHGPMDWESSVARVLVLVSSGHRTHTKNLDINKMYQSDLKRRKFYIYISSV